MKYRHASPLVIAVATALAACAVNTSPSEDVGKSSEAVSTSGVSASLWVSQSNSQMVTIVATVTNGTPNPVSNWQVALTLNESTLNQGTSGAEVNTIAGVPVFSPTVNGSVLSPGSSATFTFTVTKTGTNYMPTVSTVNGVANGTSGAGVATTGIDAIAQAAATGALNIAVAYENHKLANNGDPNYAQYDSLIWASQSYVISSGQVAFDPNVPGYAFIPNQARAALAAMQLDPGVTSYLVDGLESCFADVSGAWVYNFRAGVLKNYANNTTTTGTLNGVVPPTDSWTPAGYSINSVVDTYSTVGLPNGGNTITTTLTGVQSPSNETDYWFGLLTSTMLTAFPNTSAVAAKYMGSGNQQACSPFNGPGGTANPSFTISLNKQPVAARFQGVGQQCQNPCSSVLVMDPVGYATPGPQYDPSGNLLGPQINPFVLSATNTEAVVSHEGQWALRTANGVQTLGQFTQPVTLFGVTLYQFVAEGGP